MSQQQTVIARHTPGPWYLNDADIHSGAPGIDRWVATVSAGQGDRPHPADYANARLLAAAPELLEVVKSLLAWSDHTLPIDWRKDHPVSAAKAAIAKAEGRLA